MPRGKPVKPANQRFKSAKITLEFNENSVSAAKKTHGLKSNSLARDLLGVGRKKKSTKKQETNSTAKTHQAPDAGKHKADKIILKLFEQNKAHIKTTNELHLICMAQGIPYVIVNARTPKLKRAGLLPERFRTVKKPIKKAIVKPTKLRERLLIRNPFKAFGFSGLVSEYKALKGNSPAEKKARQQIRDVIIHQYGNHQKKGIVAFRAKVKREFEKK